MATSERKIKLRIASHFGGGRGMNQVLRREHGKERDDDDDDYRDQ
jgi:hypothetical protein